VTKEQAEEAARDLEALAGVLETAAAERDVSKRWAGVGARAENLRRAVHALRSHSPLMDALEGLKKINAADFPAGPDGEIDWSAFPVTFGYANACRAALAALALARKEP